MSSLPQPAPSDTIFTAFDLETTGSFPVSERVVEIGAVKFAADGTILGEFSELVDPEIPIPRNVIRVHGIRNRDVKGKETIEEVLPRFVRFIEDSILIAHNAGFDTFFLGVQMIRQKIPFPPNPILDSMLMCRELLPEVRRNNLRNMSKVLGMEGVKCHRAVWDSRVVREIFLNLTQGENGLVDTNLVYEKFEPIQFADARRVFQVRIPRHLPGIRKCVEKRSRLKIDYKRGKCQNFILTVDPEGLFQHNRYAYMTAYCHERGRVENFRLDRIQKIQTV